MAVVAIIPARYASQRLPGKALADLGGKPMIQRVYERARAARAVDHVLVATDDERIASAVRSFGGEARLTAGVHPSGTDRVAEVASGLRADVVVNVQGDEPLLNPDAVNAVVAALAADGGASLATLSVPFSSIDEFLSPGAVKVVTDARDRALFFSRSPVPFLREAGAPAEAAATVLARGLARRHLGVYAYRREALLRLAQLPPSPLEEAEQLEQLRALHHGLVVRVAPFAGPTGPAVDTPEDLALVRDLVRAEAAASG